MRDETIIASIPGNWAIAIMVAGCLLLGVSIAFGMLWWEGRRWTDRTWEPWQPLPSSSQSLPVVSTDQEMVVGDMRAVMADLERAVSEPASSTSPTDGSAYPQRVH